MGGTSEKAENRHRTKASTGAGRDADEDRPTGSGVRYTGKGAAPPVAAGHGATSRSASDRAYGDDQASSGKQPPAERWEADRVLVAAADILQNSRATYIESAPDRFVPALWRLHSAVTGKRDAKDVSPSDRLEVLDAAMTGLQPAIKAYMQDEDGQAWLKEHLSPYIPRLQASIRHAEASQRVEGSMMTGDGQVIEMPADDDAHAQAAALRAQLPKLISTLGIVNEQVIRANHEGIHHEVHDMQHGHGGHRSGWRQKGTMPVGSSLVDLQNQLMVLNGVLTLTDDELAEHLKHVSGFFGGVATYSHFIKGVVETTAGAMGVCSMFVGVLAQRAGNAKYASMAFGLGRGIGLNAGKVIAGIELLYAIAVICDSDATADQKLDAGVGGASSGAFLFQEVTAYLAKKGLVGAGLEAAGAAVGAFGGALMITWLKVKYFTHLYGETRLGLASGYMSMGYETIASHGDSIAQNADALAKCGILLEHETDPEKAEALRRVQTQLAERLGASVDGFIGACVMRDHTDGAGFARYPGATRIFREVFAPVAAHEGARTPAAAAAAANVALERIAWSMQHAGELMVATAKGEHLSDVERDLANQDDDAHH